MKSKVLVPFGGQFSLFAVVGAVGTCAHYLVLLALVELASVDPVAASTGGAMIGALVNYSLNRRYTFRSQKRHLQALPMFLAVATAGFVLNAAIMWLAVGVVKLHYLLAQVIATSIVLVWNYFGNKSWTFAKERICTRS